MHTLKQNWSHVLQVFWGRIYQLTAAIRPTGTQPDKVNLDTRQLSRGIVHSPVQSIDDTPLMQ